MSPFYDENWKELQRKFPLVAKKIEELRCEAVNYEQYLEQKKTLQLQINLLNAEVAVLRDLFKQLAPIAPAIPGKP